MSLCHLHPLYRVDDSKTTAADDEDDSEGEGDEESQESEGEDLVSFADVSAVTYFTDIRSR